MTPLDDASRRILQRLIVSRNQAQAAFRQAEQHFMAADADCLAYVKQLCEAKGLDPETHGVTQDLSALVKREEPAKQDV